MLKYLPKANFMYKFFFYLAPLTGIKCSTIFWETASSNDIIATTGAVFFLIQKHHQVCIYATIFRLLLKLNLFIITSNERNPYKVMNFTNTCILISNGLKQTNGHK